MKIRSSSDFHEHIILFSLCWYLSTRLKELVERKLTKWLFLSGAQSEGGVVLKAVRELNELFGISR